MGYWGNRYYGKLTMREVRERIEDDTKLTVKNLKFGYAVCVCDQTAIDKHGHNQDLLNYIMVAKWYKQDGYLMIKQIGEEMGPAELDVPLKYVNNPCVSALNEKYAVEWREKVRQFHKSCNNQQKVVRALSHGDHFFVYGELYRFQYIKNRNFVIAINTVSDKVYRIRPWQIEFTAEPLPEGFSILK